MIKSYKKKTRTHMHEKCVFSSDTERNLKMNYTKITEFNGTPVV